MKQSLAVLGLTLILTGCALSPDPVPPAPEPRAKAVVFDIDGTLTPDVLSIYSVRPYAPKSVQMYADKGYEIVYLSARIKMLQSRIPGWLEKHEFPKGFIHVTENSDDGKDHAAFKEKVLREYVDQGWNLVYAYGDSTTDFAAYNLAGIPEERVYALQRKSDEQPQPGIYHKHLVTWEEHFDFIEQVPSAK